MAVDIYVIIGMIVCIIFGTIGEVKKNRKFTWFSGVAFGMTMLYILMGMGK